MFGLFDYVFNLVYKKLQGKALKFLNKTKLCVGFLRQNMEKREGGVGYWVFSGKVIKLGIISLNEVD